MSASPFSSLTPRDACSETVSISVSGQIAYLLINNPPVNGLGASVRQGLAQGLARAQASAAVRAIVIAGEGRMFSGGADVRQFNTPLANAEPTLRQITQTIAASSKPVVAVIHGMALGGGLELALSCHYRLAAEEAKLGLPEVNLGLLPGGGGTQRLPRLIGTQAALSMITSGRPVSGTKAHQLGFVDDVFGDDAQAAVDTFVQSVLAEAPATWPLASHKQAEPMTEQAQEAALAALNPKARNALAQRSAARCVIAASSLPLEDGLDLEREAFGELVNGPESKALRHLFFAERAAAKVDGQPADIAVRPITSIGVVGAGTMGGGIAMSFVNAGLPVVLFERDQAALDRGLGLIRKNYDVSAKKGKLSAEQVAQRMALITPSLDMSAMAQVDLVIEAVFEELAVKQAVFTQLDAVCKPGAILATNTSRLDINLIAQATKRPQDVIGLHFFSPANVMKLLEVVRSDSTADDVIATSMKLAVDIGKIPVLVRVCEGFVGNRMLSPYWREAWFLLEEGATPAQIDGALTRFGMAMGPLAMGDMAGLDINWAARKRLAPTRPKDERYSRVADRICELGRFGQKTGAGYYRYENGSRTPIPDPEVDAIIAEVAMQAGIERREISDEEIVARCMLALVNEGARIVEEGIAQRPADIDVVYTSGYGFPATRGGPMFYAETLGLAKVVAQLEQFAAVHGKHWAPAPLLVEAVKAGKNSLRA